jgi:hypothetical protein
MGVDPRIDRLHDAVEVSFYFPIIEAQEPNAQGFQSPLPEFIFKTFEFVAAAIDFHRQQKLVTEEVHNVDIEWFLPAENETAPLAALQMFPKQDFRQGALMAQLTRQFFQGWIV